MTGERDTLRDDEGRPVQGCMACATYRCDGRACPHHRTLRPAPAQGDDEGTGE